MNGLGSVKFVVAAGASVVLLPQFNAQRFIEAIGRFGVTWITSVPTMLALAVREGDALSVSVADAVSGGVSVSGAEIESDSDADCDGESESVCD